MNRDRYYSYLKTILTPSRFQHSFKAQLKPLVYAGQMYKGALLQMDRLISFMEDSRIPVTVASGETLHS